MDARVDTGAAKSSMAAVDLRVTGKEVEFSLPGLATKERVRLPIHGWVQVRTNLGKERRPLVQVEICLAGQRLRTLSDLDDRTGLKYPMLLGRETLRGRFLVDVGRMHLHPEPCFGAQGGRKIAGDRGRGPSLAFVAVGRTRGGRDLASCSKDPLKSGSPMDELSSPLRRIWTVEARASFFSRCLRGA